MRFSVIAALALSTAGFVLAPTKASAAVPNVVEMTADQIQLGLALGQFTVTELVQAYLTRIKNPNPDLEGA